MVAFETLAENLRHQGVDLLFKWFPEGRVVGREFCIGNLAGEKGQSLRVNQDSGRWSDFATGQKGGDFISLYAAKMNLGQYEAARELGGDEVAMNGHAVELRPAISEAPVDETFELPPSNVALGAHAFPHPKHGLPAHVYVYRSADRSPIMVVARYEFEDDKTFLPWTWRNSRWRSKSAPKPRPLYGLERLESYPGATIIVEGEKKADALQGVTQRSSVITWPGGAPGWRYADWSSLRGRSCILWPDADPPGFSAMQGIAGVLLKMDCRLRIIDTEGLTDGFDAADVVRLDPSPSAVNAWILPRLRPLEPVISQPPQRVLEPKTIRPAVTVDEVGERIPEAESEAPSYSIAARYGLSYTKSGINANLSNARALIEGRISEGGWPPLYYDEFLQKTMTDKREWADHDTLAMADRMQRQYGMVQIRKNTVEDAVNLYAGQNKRNSAQEWLNSLEWDGEARIDSLFSRGFGAEEGIYTEKVSKCFLIGMVARVLNPGCQVDTLPVLEGEQGIRKTSALRVLGGEYHAECQESATGKDFYLVLAGKMLVEIAEFHAFKTSDVERLNGIITCRTDRYRAPYERRASDHPRSGVFVATTNRDDWNRDPTGARRFQPIACTQIDIEWIKQYREQLLAEAVTRFKAGESWWDVPTDLAKYEQDKRRDEDVLSGGLRYYCSQHPQVYMVDVMRHLDLKGTQAYDRLIQARLTNILRSWGYRCLSIRDEFDKVAKVWVDPKSKQSEEDHPY